MSGESIPLEGRIAALADVFEALCADRVYRPGWPIQDARDFIRSGRGSHFDPACVDAFEASWDEIVRLMLADADQSPPLAIAS